ncbi:hypothetical protein ALC57_04350 [Trachymyrmex cornetzi]|uniref:DNA-directed DNA polymerase n=1 Tax=Trachymyrmex cornetzi TaxID=471704 RepID=A0A151JCW9_9HYME|nr:hypothetical protein ALC57_04350 [Trachymyrmex cornetzi]
MENHERVERELLEQCGQVATLVECFAWLQRCDECIERIVELCLTGAVINFNHIEPRRFLEDAREIVLERVQDAIERHGSVKVNTAFNGEFATKDKRAIKSINIKNIEIYRACTTSVRAQSCIRTQWIAGWSAFYRRRSPTRKMRTHISGPKYAMCATTCVAHTTTRYRRISSVAIKTVYHDSRDNSTIWRIALDKLASYLDKDKLKIVCSEFSTLSDEKFELLTRKGVFPYEYVDCVEKFQDTRLPPRESFYSSLTGDTVSESDYAHAVNVWQRFSIRTLGEYSDLYLKTDVLLLADIFENFRESCVVSYGLDPANYYTLPGFTWDAMLKHTRVRFELLTDIDMVMFIERGIRGGLSQCSNRYAQANNKYMRSYNSSKPSTYLMYYDVNNLYGWAMCQPLPYAEFRWIKDVVNFDASAIVPDSPTGYILEVDLEYPQHLHDQHIDLPFCPTRDKPPGKREDKLLATLYDKQRYIIHYRNMQQCTRHGLRVTKIHRVLQFAQFPWLREYIQLNTNFRTRAKNDFEKNLYKLMNNAVFGKTMENVRKHVDVKLITKWDGRYGAGAMIAKPNFHSRSVFAENLIAVGLRKLEVKFNKPIYVGMCILDISKVCLYEFHHEYILPLFRDKCKIMYTDTDSLIYRIECDDAYECMKRDIARFDTSDYPADNAYGMSLANKKVPGLMKDENNGMIMTEFVGLRAKMYAVMVDGKKDTKKAKDVKSNVVARTITFNDYTRCLNEEIEMTCHQSCIRSKLHEVYTIPESKIALSPYDDKRYVVPDSTETLPWGHWRIPL